MLKVNLERVNVTANLRYVPSSLTCSCSVIAGSSLTSATIDPSDYALRRELHPKLTMYARIDGVKI